MSTFNKKETLLILAPSMKLCDLSLGVRYGHRRELRKPYDRFTDEDRYVIATYFAQDGPIATVKHFKPKFPNLTESHVRNFRDKYRKLLSKELQDGNGQNSVSSILRGMGGNC